MKQDPYCIQFKCPHVTDSKYFPFMCVCGNLKIGQDFICADNSIDYMAQLTKYILNGEKPESIHLFGYSIKENRDKFLNNCPCFYKAIVVRKLKAVI